MGKEVQHYLLFHLEINNQTAFLVILISSELFQFVTLLSSLVRVLHEVSQTYRFLPSFQFLGGSD